MFWGICSVCLRCLCCVGLSKIWILTRIDYGIILKKERKTVCLCAGILVQVSEDIEKWHKIHCKYTDSESQWTVTFMDHSLNIKLSHLCCLKYLHLHN